MSGWERMTLPWRRCDGECVCHVIRVGGASEGDRGHKVSSPLCPRRLGMLSEEAVPRADNVLMALTKHLEVKLAFGETGSQIKAETKAEMKAA